METDTFIKMTKNLIIVDSFVKADSVLNRQGYKNIWCSVSGGADSDVILDICTKINPSVQYVFFDTGIEYRATLEHLDELEKKYNITIHRVKAATTVPVSCKKYGQPFLSKYVSKNVENLQNHGFDWTDRPYEELAEQYPNCLSALRWWCSKYTLDGFENSRFSIDRNKYLKEFMVKHPPTYRISGKCCYGSKKKPSKDFVKENGVDLMVMGIRKAEGGIRAAAYKSCYAQRKNNVDQYMPIFWYTNHDREEYEKTFGITHSRCYTEYGFKRTGCCCCPFSKNYKDELKVIERHEPMMSKAVSKIFGDSYEYTRKYREFAREIKEKEKAPLQPWLF